MDQDIQFGEVAETRPEPQLRPDHNRQFTLVAYGQPAERDLPIFIALDAMRDMEIHAESDKSVELGGVLLGGQYEDDEGRPFVVVSDSLRASHYESTKGSFKFTHETWSDITRQRETFPAELQMVGWYHTHPDWGVFLSGMDMFICDNFFNKPLDVALVIDPCRRDRGLFQWTGQPRERIRQTGGFHLFASRHRQAELEQFLAQLEGKITMADPRFPSVGSHAPSYAAPVINVSDPRGGWLGIAVLGMLSTQFLLVVLLAWKLFATPPEATKTLEKFVAQQEATDRLRAQERVLNQVVAQLRDSSSQDASLLTDKEQKISELEQTRRMHLRVNEVLSADLKDSERSRKDAFQEIEALSKQVTNLKGQVEFQIAAEKKLDKELRDLKKESTHPQPPWYWLLGSAAAGAVVAGVAVTTISKQGAKVDSSDEKSSGIQSDNKVEEADDKAN